MSDKASMPPGLRRLMRRLVPAGLAVALAFAGPAAAQNGTTDFRARLFDMMPGTPIADIPARYSYPHCGTNGGPPSTRLTRFADYAACPPDPTTGLHEVWFSENDEAEYVGLAYRSSFLGTPGPFAANVLYNHKVIYSLLIDDAGLVQGYRIFTDPGEAADYRVDADFVGDGMKGVYGYSNFHCDELDPAPNETPINGRFLKEVCVADIDTRHVVIERHYYYKPGQSRIDPLTGEPTTNQFESTSRIEVLNRDLVPAGQDASPAANDGAAPPPAQ